MVLFFSLQIRGGEREPDVFFGTAGNFVEAWISVFIN